LLFGVELRVVADEALEVFAPEREAPLMRYDGCDDPAERNGKPRQLGEVRRQGIPMGLDPLQDFVSIHREPTARAVHPGLNRRFGSTMNCFERAVKLMDASSLLRARQ
jgi:hypothetical protein